MKLDIEKISKKYGTVLKENGESECKTIDDVFNIIDTTPVEEYEEEFKKWTTYLCLNDYIDELVANISDTILCGRLMEKLLDEDKFTDDPEMNQKIVAKINQFIEEKGL